MTGRCLYCTNEAPVRVTAEESGMDSDLRVCRMHWGILKNPITAMPFLRGVAASRLRGLPDSESKLNEVLDSYMSKLAEMKPVD